MTSAPPLALHPAGSTARPGWTAMRAAGPPLVLGVLLLAAWWIAARLLNSTVFPAPPESLRSLLAELDRSDYRSSLQSTVGTLLESYSLCVAVGTLAGLTIGLSQFWRDSVTPLLYLANSIPKVVFYPVFLLFLGIGDLSRISFAFVSGVVPMLLITMEGAAAVGRSHLKLAASLQISYPALIRRIVIPSAMPSLATGARLTFGTTFLGLLLAEMFAGSGGLGYELLRSISLVRLQDILGEVILIAVLALVPTLALRRVEIQIRRRYAP